MKKKIAVSIIGIAVSAIFLTACEASKGLETDDIKITQYKGVEVDQVQKPAEITDEDVENWRNTEELFEELGGSDNG